ncbi:MAG TPA: hypothetical protein PLD47_15780 [Aggregatilineales bacterium]|nr:hypothetical protein [Anaerolineales bacterium]HRE49189.1 hypothetical protein [Aggregatilineales bacterium]
MRIRVEGRRPLRGTYHISANTNAAIALITAAMLSPTPVSLVGLPDTVGVGVLLEVAGTLGLTTEANGAVTTLHTPEMIGRALSREHTDALSGTFLLIAPILARRRHARMTIDYPLSRLHPHLRALRDLGVGITMDGGVIDLKAAVWKQKEIVLSQASVTATVLTAILAAALGEQTTIRHAACEPHVVDALLLLGQMGARIEGAGSNLVTIYGRGGKDDLAFDGAPFPITPDHIEAASVAALAVLSGGWLTIEGTRRRDMKVITPVYERLGVQLGVSEDALNVPAHDQLRLSARDEDVDVAVESAPWYGFPSDLIGMATVIATQAQGTVLIHEKLYSNRLLFVDKLNAMGAQIVLCDPHRAIVIGGTRLNADYIDNPDARIGLAMLGAAFAAEGETVIDTAEAFERTFDHVLDKLVAVGAGIRRG